MSQAATAKGAIDLDHLDRQTFGDRALRDEVLAIFASQVAALDQELRGASAQTRARLAHTIKGAALGIGAHRLAQSATLLEASPEDDDLAAALAARAEEAARFIANMRD